MAHGFPDWSPIATGASSELPTYRTTVTIPVLAANNPSNMFSIFNPVGSGEDVKIRRLRLTIIDQFTTDAVQTPDVLIARTSTAGTGTAMSPLPNDAADPPTATLCKYIMTVAPVVTANWLQLPFGTERKVALQPSRMSALTYPVDIFNHPAAGQLKPVRLRPGEGIRGAMQNHLKDLYIGFDLEWTEEPYS